MLIRRTLLLAGLLGATLAPAAAQAPWPSRPIRIVVPYGPGSSPDVLVRLFGDKLGSAAVGNGWAGVIIHGCIRDSVALGRMDLGIRALGTMPLRSDKRGEGERDVPVRFAGVTFRPGEFVYVDEDGIIVYYGNEYEYDALVEVIEAELE